MAGVNNSTLYPPIIDSMMPAFIWSQGECRVYFSLSVMTSLNQVNDKLIQVVVNNQNTNLSELDSDLYPAGIKLTTLHIDEQKSGDDKYYIIINQEDLKNKVFEVGKYYKVQIRLTSKNLTNKSRYTLSWFNKNVEHFSEWSTVCLIRAIDKPEININYFGTEESGIYIVSSTNIDVVGNVIFNENDIDRLKYYNIKIYNSNGDLIQTSDNVYTSSNYIDYTFIQELETNCKYQMQVTIVTVLGYEDTNVCDFIVKEDDFLAFEKEVVITADNVPDIGGVRISATYKGTEEPLRSNITYRRASSEDNFTSWVDVKTVAINQDKFYHEWYDLTVKSGIQYIYKVQRRASVGVRGQASQASNPVIVDFEDIFFTAEGKNLRIRYNPKISSFKVNVLENKTETLGSKYPFIKRNGDVYYHSIQLSGIISLQSDMYIEPENNVGNRSLMQAFVEEEIYNEYGDIIGFKEIPEGANLLTYDRAWHSVWKPEDNIDIVRKYNYNLKRNEEGDSYFKEIPLLKEDYVAEREYRDEVMDFLYKHNIKLMRTDTEGNFLVKLMDISLSPAGIGRQLYQFSATAYEVAEVNAYNLSYYNIQNTGNLEEITDEKLILGQYLSQGDLESSYKFEKVLNGDLIDALTEKYANYFNIPGLSASAKELRFLRIEISDEQKPYMTSFGLKGYEVVINGTHIYIKPNQTIYELRGDDVLITSLYFPKQTKCLIDYVVKIELKEDKSQLKKSYRHEIKVGQIYDFYMTGEDLLKVITDKYNYREGKNFSHVIGINDINIETEAGIKFKIGFYNEEPSIFEINDYNVLNLCDSENLNLTHLSLLSLGEEADEKIDEIKQILKQYEDLSKGVLLADETNLFEFEELLISVPPENSILQELKDNFLKAYEEIKDYKILIDYCIELERGEYY